MRALFVIVSAPIFHLFLRVRKTKVPVRVETFHPEAHVKRLDEGVVGRLVRSAEVQRDAVRVCSQIEFARDELRAQIDADRLRMCVGRTIWTS